MKIINNKINENRLGLTLGIFLAGLHVLWSVILASGNGQALLDNAMSLHFLNINYQILDFNFSKFILLVITTFVAGYISGYVLAYLWNFNGRK